MTNPTHEGYTRTADLLFIGGMLHQLWVPGHPNTGNPVYLPVPSADSALAEDPAAGPTEVNLAPQAEPVAPVGDTSPQPG